MKEEDKLSITKIKLKIPKEKWISEIFDNLPDTELDILNFFPYDFEMNIGNAIIEIKHYKIDQIINILSIHPSIFEFVVLNKLDNQAKINIKTKNPFLLFSVIKCGGIIDFPIEVREKFLIGTIISTRNQLDKILDLYKTFNIEYLILEISNTPEDFEERANNLSFEESKILNTAVKFGFFEVPRKISLEEISNILGKSKSGTSELLRKIIKKKIILTT